MSDGSNIQWTDATWNPTRGCTRVDVDCLNCYAEHDTARFSGPGLWGEGFARWKLHVIDGDTERNEARWTGKVALIPERLAVPLRWCAPRRIFVNSESDLFHETLTDEEIAAVFGVMAACPQHTFQVLTKRAARLPEWFAWAAGVTSPLTTNPREVVARHAAALIGAPVVARALILDGPWPLPNLHLGISAGAQPQLDERWPYLARTPAAVRVLSLEPLLGPIDLWETQHGTAGWPVVDWVIVGGESGHGARPCDVRWISNIVEQCKAAGVPVFVKQLGSRVVGLCTGCDGGGKMRIGDDPEWCATCGGAAPVTITRLRHRKGGNIDEWPEALRVREFPR